MFSYLIGGIAALIFLINPISELFFPQQANARRDLSRPPQLNESLLAINPPNFTLPECPPDAYVAHILRSQPLVVYLENFLSQDEREHLLNIRYIHPPLNHRTTTRPLTSVLPSEPIFEPSTISKDGQTTLHDPSIRDSSVAIVPRTSPVICIETRAFSFQGWRRSSAIERLRTQRYGVGGHYNHHFDWTRGATGWGRVSSFMAWVSAYEDLVGGGTEFPLLRLRGERDSDLCNFIECDDPEVVGDGTEQKGTVFKVKPGNAVYWENFAPDGRGYDETWHAALPVEKGVKVGLNIWTFGRIE